MRRIDSIIDNMNKMLQDNEYKLVSYSYTKQKKGFSASVERFSVNIEKKGIGGIIFNFAYDTEERYPWMDIYRVYIENGKKRIESPQDDSIFWTQEELDIISILLPFLYKSFIENSDQKLKMLLKNSVLKFETSNHLLKTYIEKTTI